MVASTLVSSTADALRPTATIGASARVSAGADKLLVFIAENHSLSEMRDQMPWTFNLAKTYGYATNYHGVAHPSLPNYLAIAGGSTFGITDDNDPSAHRLRGHSVFGVAKRAGLSARVYADSMPSPCAQRSSGEYAVRHNPWAYFPLERKTCTTYDTSLRRFGHDVRTGRLPRAGMVVPNLCHDAHDCSLATTDAWLKQYVGVAMSGPDFASGRLAIVITADEDDGSQANTVLTVMVNPSVRGVVTDQAMNHLSLSRLYTQVLGLRPLRKAASASSMVKAFGLKLRH